VGSYVITIKRLRELAGKPWPMAVRVAAGPDFAKAEALSPKMTRVYSRVATADLRLHATGQII
jgi:hypothetical protein